MKKSIISLSLVTTFALAESFTLGQVSVQDSTKDINMFEKSITADDISKHSSDTISDALDNISGVSQNAQGARAESTLQIRGFDAKRVGVFIDGVPIYIPYDGNFDYNRFLTTDIGQIDVSKGYSSVAYGSNAMGGVVNIVSKKPTKEFEGNVKGKLVLDSEGKEAKHMESVNLGTFQNGFYAQLGAVYSNQDHFRLSDEYKATSTQPSGDRLRSENEDQKINLKAGYITNDKSEVAISYINQKGQKQNPLSVDPTFASSPNKYFDWPYWDKEIISIVGQKNFDNSYVKALAYYDKSKNSLYAYDDITYTTIKKPYTFKSKYDDYSYGTRLEYGVDFMNNFLKAAANYKKDVHRGYDISKTSSIETLTEQYEDHTISLGVEDTYAISKNLEFLAGISYDKREADKIYDTNTAFLSMLKLKSNDSTSPQAALIYTFEDNSKIKASVAQKTYLPSMKDRYSRRLGQAAPNPDLENETATHYELSYKKQQGAYSATLSGFYSHIRDYIQSMVYAPTPTLLQNQNVGTFDHRGAELELTYKQDTLKVGGNYTYISIKNEEDTNVMVVNVPRHQVFVFAQKEVGNGVSLYANMKFRNGAYEQKVDNSYVANPSMTTFDIKAIYEPTKNLTAELGVKNLTDELVRYNMAYPMAGREFFASLEYKF